MEQSLEKLLQELELYISENWVPPTEEKPEAAPFFFDEELSDIDDDFYVGDEDFCDEDEESFGESDEDVSKSGSVDNASVSLESLIREVGKSFHETLFDLIRASGMTDVEVYKRANIDRRFFSKIRSNPAYHPRKTTVLALAIALKLTLPQTEDLLSRAEYALSPGSKSDVIIRFFIERKIYDIHTINIALHDHNLPILE